MEKQREQQHLGTAYRNTSTMILSRKEATVPGIGRRAWGEKEKGTDTHLGQATTKDRIYPEQSQPPRHDRRKDPFMFQN